MKTCLGATNVPAKLVMLERTARKVCITKRKLLAKSYHCNNCCILVYLDIDECLPSNPCLNEADCINTPGGYYCICYPGFIGANCSKGDEHFHLLRFFFFCFNFVYYLTISL